MKEAANRAALLFLLGVKGDFFGVQLLGEFLDGIKGGPIRDPPRYVSVLLNPDVDLNALLAHSQSPHSRVVDATNSR